ncbi:phage head closure protein [Oenococcus sicerae]|uniref:Phage head closure protein n=1 Tax=Oenococcus sicerae TaxID=2203724 RepID=A0AAJ1VPZ0_9LACO|nr:phage head closure protein [Oenococcus sicerae]MDN6899572.1 hypothetical protein [Oenococcus sicerae]
MMQFSDVITLITQIHTTDQDANDKIVDGTLTPVYADVFTAGRDEFNAAGVNGIKAEYVFKIHTFEYSNEPIVEYNGSRYSVYRTSGKGDNTYLYVQQKVGV